MFVLPLIGLIVRKRVVPVSELCKAIAIIPAYNEERVIGRIIKDCKLAGFNEVWVIADSCTDDTVQIAGMLNCCVIVTSERSKSFSLNVAVPQILKEQSNRTLVYFFDADNHIDNDFLKCSHSFVQFYKIVQFRVRNYNYDTWLSRMYIIMMGYTFRIQEAFYNLHISNLTCGTGWACLCWVLKKYPFNNRTMTDLEYAIKIPLRIKYINSVDVYDEKPSSWSVSVKQRVRWVRGHLQLLLGSYRGYIFQKLYILLFPILDLLIMYLFLSRVIFHTLNFLEIVFLSVCFHVIYFFVLIDYKDLKHVKLHDFITFSFFTLSNYFIVVYAFLTFSKKFWYRTPHKGGVL